MTNAGLRLTASRKDLPSTQEIFEGAVRAVFEYDRAKNGSIRL